MLMPWCVLRNAYRSPSVRRQMPSRAKASMCCGGTTGGIDPPRRGPGLPPWRYFEMVAFSHGVGREPIWHRQLSGDLKLITLRPPEKDRTRRACHGSAFDLAADLNPQIPRQHSCSCLFSAWRPTGAGQVCQTSSRGRCSSRARRRCAGGGGREHRGPGKSRAQERTGEPRGRVAKAGQRVLQTINWLKPLPARKRS